MTSPSAMKLEQDALSSDKVAAHNKAEPSLKQRLFRTQFKKTILCTHFAAGKCKTGKSCVFAHGPSELKIAPDLTKTSMCAAWLKSECDKSPEICKFAHGVADLHTTPLFHRTVLKKNPQACTSAKDRADSPPPSTLTQTRCSSRMGDADQVDSTRPSPRSPTWHSKSDRSRTSDTDEGDDEFQLSFRIPQVPPTVVVFVIPPAPADQWIMSMSHYATFAPKHFRDRLAERLLMAAPEHYDD